ncbi:TonB-dependent receptor [Salmonella enterica]|nr:TonB-dependent receptor [Salmonella enterica]
MAKLNGVLGLQYDKTVNINGINGNLKADVVWQLQGKRAADVKNSFYLPGYTVLNTRLGWQHENWEFYGFAWNILDKQYLVGGQQWGNGVSSVRVGQPRIIGMGISVDF